MLKQQIQEIMSMKQEMEAKRQQEMEYQKYIWRLIQKLQKLKQNGQMLMAIYDYIMKQPENYRPMLDTPQGWRMVDDILKNMAQPTSKPDNIIASKTTQPAKPDLKGMSGHDQDFARTENILRQLGM